MKVVINDKFGGFGLSHKAVMRYAELKGINLYPYIDDISRKVYGDRATLDNPAILIHYPTIPIKHEDEITDEHYFNERDIKRTDPLLLKVIEEMGNEANGRYAQLKVIEVPDDVEWEIEEYDGTEWVTEKHKTWR